MSDKRDSSRPLLFEVEQSDSVSAHVERSDSVSAWETTEPVAKTEASVTTAATPLPPPGEQSMCEGEGEGEDGEEGDGYDSDLGTVPWPKRKGPGAQALHLPYAGTHFDISDSRDPIAMMLLMAADPVAMVALGSSYFLPVLILLAVAVWVSGVRMCEELTAEEDQLCREMYVKEFVLSQEWFVISIVFASLAVPILLSFNRDLESVRSMWRFAVAVPESPLSHGATRKLRLAASIKVLDIVQPLLALTVSAYVSLMLSEGQFFNVFLNILVLEFVTTVDSAIVDNVLKMERFDGKPLSVALYPVREIHADQWDDCMSLGEAEVKLRLRDLDFSNAAKWTLLTDVERGLGIGSPFPVSVDYTYDEGELNECRVRLSLVDWQAAAPGDAQRWLSGMGYKAFREQLSRQQRLRLPQLVLLPSLIETLGTSHSGVEIELSQSDSFSEADGSPSLDIHALAYLGCVPLPRRDFGAMATKRLCARKLVSSCAFLARLSIKHSPLLVDDELMAELGMHCPNLTHLHVDCQRPGKKGLARGEPNTQLTDKGLASLARCSRLSVLDLSGCTASSDAGVTKLLDCCHNLRELKLNFSPVTTAILKPCVDAFALQRVELYKTGLRYKDVYDATRINADGTNRHALTRRRIFVFFPYITEEE